MLDKLDLIVEIENLLDESEFFPYGHPNWNYHWKLITAPFIKNGKFTVENFLSWLEFIEPTTWEDFVLNFELDITSYEYDCPELVKEYQNTLDFIQENLQNIQVYKINLEGINEETEEDCLVEDLYCIIGQVKENYWLGIVPDFFDSEHGGVSSKQFVIGISDPKYSW